MDIELNKPTKVRSKPYRLNKGDREDLAVLVDEYECADIVTETVSEYASPVFVVRKGDGSARMVVDYKKLNKATKVLHHQIINFDDLVQKLGEAKIFAKLDLACGYLQMLLTEKAK